MRKRCSHNARFAISSRLRQPKSRKLSSSTRTRQKASRSAATASFSRLRTPARRLMELSVRTVGAWFIRRPDRSVTNMARFRTRSDCRRARRGFDLCQGQPRHLAFSILVGMLEGVAIMAALTAQACPSHMVRMMQRLGLEPGGGVVPHLSLSHIAAFHRCEACPCKQACRDWLDSAPASVLLAPRFCPNAGYLL